MKKTNPRRRPATMADVSKATKLAQSDALRTAWAIFFTVMRDKEGYGMLRLRRLWDEVNKLSESVSEGRVSVGDLIHTLKAEYDIELK